MSLSLNSYIKNILSSCVQYLGEAASGAVFAPGGEVPELDVQQFHQLCHRPHRGWHVARTQGPFGLLRQLPGDNRCRFTRPELDSKQRRRKDRCGEERVCESDDEEGDKRSVICCASSNLNVIIRMVQMNLYTLFYSCCTIDSM